MGSDLLTSWNWCALKNRYDLESNQVGNVEPYQHPNGNLHLLLGKDSEVEQQN